MKTEKKKGGRNAVGRARKRTQAEKKGKEDGKSRQLSSREKGGVRAISPAGPDVKP